MKMCPALKCEVTLLLGELRMTKLHLIIPSYILIIYSEDQHFISLPQSWLSSLSKAVYLLETSVVSQLFAVKFVCTLEQFFCSKHRLLVVNSFLLNLSRNLYAQSNLIPGHIEHSTQQILIGIN